MRRRETIREAAEQAVKETLGREWMTAKEVADRLGFPWRVVARTLKRMAAKGSIEMSERTNVAARWRVRKRPCYRACLIIEKPPGPAWFVTSMGWIK